eukprot:TRINITY_DN6863_c0_g1_i1.p1 TRINITY_DN6863_c0_g1~~TRINITY_DN6863_c0_g1_i1.p1  ORF type:complete len:131 (+),score=6.95 TRINITY_DN6863_c0_g1_i1:146-538(+)
MTSVSLDPSSISLILSITLARSIVSLSPTNTDPTGAPNPLEKHSDTVSNGSQYYHTLLSIIPSHTIPFHFQFCTYSVPMSISFPLNSLTPSPHLSILFLSTHSFKFTSVATHAFHNLAPSKCHFNPNSGA